MKWTSEAEGAVKRVPFFIRKRVKKRVAEEAERQASSLVTLDHVKTCQERFLKNMDAEVKGFQVEACFGLTGCPNAVVVDPELVHKLEKKLEQRNLREFLKEKKVTVFSWVENWGDIPNWDRNCPVSIRRRTCWAFWTEPWTTTRSIMKRGSGWGRF